MDINLLAPFGVGGAPTLPASKCPAGPAGQVQSADVVIRAMDWATLNNVIWGLVLLVAIIAVVTIYRTQLMGVAFSHRWWKGWLATSVVALALGTVVAALMPVSTFGCQFGDVATKVPMLVATGRGLLAAVWSLLWVMIISVILIRVSRVSGWQPFARNSRTPF